MIHETDLNGLLPVVNSLLSGSKADFSAFVSNEQPRILSKSVYSTSQGEVKKKVSVIPIKSVITKYDYCGEMGMLTFERLLNDLRSDDSIGAVVFDMDTGGGEASYMPHVAAAIRNLKSSKPVLTYFSGYCCSAGYYIASQSDRVYASHRLDTVGSIGTMVSVTVPNGNSQVDWIRVYATKSTEKNKHWEGLISGKPESYIKEVLDPFNDAFHNDVSTGRPGLPDEVFTGKSVTADEGVNLKLVDGIKSLNEVIEEAFSLIK